MTSSRVTILVAMVLFVTVYNANAASQAIKDKIMADGLPVMMECAKEMDIDMEKIKEMKGEPEHACFAACYFKKVDVIDENGMFSLEAAKSMLKKIGEGESEDDVKELDQLILKCASVNDEPVSDGAKGCDRAALLQKCFHST